MSPRIPFNRVHLTGNEQKYIQDALTGPTLSGDGRYTRRASEWMEREFGANKVLITPSCTAALEMAAILAGVGPGDEVILPSYTFVSTANAFVLRGATPVFVDVDPASMNIDPACVQAAITSRTKAIVPVHYAGVACNMEALLTIARDNNLVVIEDAAQAIFSTYAGKQLGTIGDLGCLSFHDTKNITCGEGGALLINNKTMIERAQTIRDKGTNRHQFLAGAVDKYTWRDIGSSYLPAEMSSAFLLAQLEAGKEITRARLKAWTLYSENLKTDQWIQFSAPPTNDHHNGHMFFGILHEAIPRPGFIRTMREEGVQCTSHYEPLHLSPAGRLHGRHLSNLPHTEAHAPRLVRFPMYAGVDDVVAEVCDTARKVAHGLVQ